MRCVPCHGCTRCCYHMSVTQCFYSGGLLLNTSTGASQTIVVEGEEADGKDSGLLGASGPCGSPAVASVRCTR